MRWIALLVIAAFTVSMIGIGLGARVYPWELIVADCMTLVWALLALGYASLLKRERGRRW